MTEYKADLSKVSILVKTFLRDLHLYDALIAITKTLPECKMIVVDDGDMSVRKRDVYKAMRENGHTVIELPFDEGFGVKSNAGAAACDTPYLLIGSDDFNFAPPSCRHGIEKMVAVLDGDTNVHIASGRVNNVPYEGWLIDEGKRVTEKYINHNTTPMEVNGAKYRLANLTVNYSLIRCEILGFGEKQVHWFNECKIGQGEHGAFFVEALRSGYGVAYVEGANILEQSPKATDPRYQSFRGRARQPGRQAFKNIGVEEYVLFSGTVEKA